ncbi:MAG TPA: hypothetical protein VFB34_13555 [Chloroflexota bacterium]|nr:hypothetical protein [Chloroflexota bacterium]
MEAEREEWQPGARVEVETRDGHRFHGRLLEIRNRAGAEDVAVIRFDTGWVTSYPVSMVRQRE